MATKILRPATDKQISFLRKLAAERNLTDEQAAFINRPLNTGEARESMTMLLKMPRKPADEAPVKVPAGRYALNGEATDGEWAFYQIDRPGENSKWFGHTFLSALYGAPGDFRRVAIKGQAAKDIMAEIEAVGPKQAAMAFGRETGTCSICAATLTDPASVAAGIGPICARRFA